MRAPVGTQASMPRRTSQSPQPTSSSCRLQRTNPTNDQPESRTASAVAHFVVASATQSAVDEKRASKLPDAHALQRSQRRSAHLAQPTSVSSSSPPPASAPSAAAPGEGAGIAASAFALPRPTELPDSANAAASAGTPASPAGAPPSRLPESSLLPQPDQTLKASVTPSAAHEATRNPRPA